MIVPKKLVGQQWQTLNQPTNDTFAKSCVQELLSAFLRYGRGPDEPTLKAGDFTIDTQTLGILDDGNYENDFDQMFATAIAKKPSTQLAIFFSPTKNGLSDAFGDFKRVAETRYGLHTVCIAAQAAHNARHYVNKNQQARNLLPQVMGNISMKLNLKLGNINHGFDIMPTLREKLFLQTDDPENMERVDTMILGGDVTHPLQGSADPSISAIVGSVDEHFAKYLGSVRYQKGGTEVSQSH